MKYITEGVFLLLLTAAAYTDLRDSRIPNQLILALGVWGIMIRSFPGIYLWIRYPSLLQAGYGSLSGYLWQCLGTMGKGMLLPIALLLPLYLIHALGAGDVKLLAVVGMTRGWPGCLSCLFLIGLWAAGIALVDMLYHGTLKTRLLHLGTYLQSIGVTGKIGSYGEEPRTAGSHMALALPVLLGNLTWLLR